MDAAAIRIGTGRSEEEAWAVGYQIERALNAGGTLALEFESDAPPTAELFDILLARLREAMSRGAIVEVRNAPSWLLFAFETPDGRDGLASAG